MALTEFSLSSCLLGTSLESLGYFLFQILLALDGYNCPFFPLFGLNPII